jgi:hypothetical protein
MKFWYVATDLTVTMIGRFVWLQCSKQVGEDGRANHPGNTRIVGAMQKVH